MHSKARPYMGDCIEYTMRAPDFVPAATVLI